MKRILVAAGSSAAMMGVGLICPVVFSRIESGALSRVGVAVLAVGCVFVASGIVAVLVGLSQRNDSGLHRGVSTAVAANILFLAFFALESSDRLVRQGGNFVYWSTYLFLPTLLLFYGLLTARPWAWWIFRGVAALGTLWFLGFVLISPFANLQSHGMVIPWYGRIYVASVSLVLAATLAGAFWSLGLSETRRYFRLTQIKATRLSDGRL